MVLFLLNQFHFISSTRGTGQEDRWAAGKRRRQLSRSVHLSTSVNISFIIKNINKSGSNILWLIFSGGPPVLELISLHSKTAATQRLISVHIAKSRTNDAGEPLNVVSWQLPVLSHMWPLYLFSRAAGWLYFCFLFQITRGKWEEALNSLKRRLYNWIEMKITQNLVSVQLDKMFFFSCCDCVYCSINVTSSFFFLQPRKFWFCRLKWSILDSYC